MALRFSVIALAALSLPTTHAFSPSAVGGMVSLRGASGISASRPFRPALGLKMQQKTDAKASGDAAKAGGVGEPNLCDVNEQLCDGKPHLMPDMPAGTETLEKKEEKENLMTKVKDAGVAGLISYALWEFVFWAVGTPAAIIIYHQTTGEWPSFDNPESTAKVSAVVFGFLNIARALVPVRIGLTLATAPLVDTYIVKPFSLGKNKDAEKDA